MPLRRLTTDPRTAAALLSALCLAACTSTERPDRAAANSVDSTGAYPVHHARTPAARWRAELVAEIGASPEGGSEFGGLRSVALGPGGIVAVLDHRTPQVVAYSADGAKLGAWGRTGAGPGEYRWPYAIAFVGDSLALFDPGRSRITLYDAERRWLREWVTPANTGGAPVRLYPNAPEAFWAYATRPAAQGLERVYVRYQASGPTDTIPIPSYEFPPSESANCNSPDGSISFFEAPFTATLLSTPLRSRERVAAISTAYRLAFLSPAGDTTRVIERLLAPAAVTDSMWEAATAVWTEFRRRIPTAHCSRESFSRPATAPIVHALVTDDAGALWVEARGAEGVLYDVFTPEGVFVATVSGLPASRGTVPSVRGDRVAVVVADSLGEQRVRVYRVRRD